QELVKALSGQGSSSVRVKNGQVVGGLGPFIDVVKQDLVKRGFTLVSKIPAVNPTLTLFSARYLVKAQTGYRLINDLKIVLPILTMLLLALGVRRPRPPPGPDRRRARPRRVDAGARLGAVYLPRPLPGQRAEQQAARRRRCRLVRHARPVHQGSAPHSPGSGPGRRRRRVPGRADGDRGPDPGGFAHGLGQVRRGGEHAGLRTGPVGTWTYAHRRALRISAVALAALVFVFRGLPTAVVVIAIAVLLVVVLGLIELIGSKPPAQPEEAGQPGHRRRPGWGPRCASLASDHACGRAGTRSQAWPRARQDAACPVPSRTGAVGGIRRRRPATRSGLWSCATSYHRGRTFRLGLVCGGGRVGFLESLVGDIMSLRGPAQIGELVRHKGGFGNGRQPADSRLAAGQLRAEPLAIGLVEAQALVVQRAQQPAADQADAEPDRGDQRQDQADTGTLAHAALADLPRFDLALVVKDQDADGVVVRHPRVLQGGGRRVGRYLVFEDRQDHSLVRHQDSLLRRPRAITAPGNGPENRPGGSSSPRFSHCTTPRGMQLRNYRRAAADRETLRGLNLRSARSQWGCGPRPEASRAAHGGAGRGRRTR